MFRDDINLPGILVQETNETGLITRCVSSHGADDTANKFAIGCQLVHRDNGKLFINTGSSAVPSWTDVNDTILVDTNAKIGETYIQYAEVDITAADIIDTEAAGFGHVDGVPLVVSPGAGKVLELISAVLLYTFDTAAYTDGGNISINWDGGAAITGVVAAGDSIGAGADKLVQLLPLATAGNAVVEDSGINLVAAAAFTDPGTAVGTAKVKIAYRVHTL